MSTPNPNIAATVKRYYLQNLKKRTPENPTRGTDWARVAITLNNCHAPEWLEDDDWALEPMTANDAKQRVKNWSGWKPIADELERLELEKQAIRMPPSRPAGLTAEEAIQKQQVQFEQSEPPFVVERVASGYVVRDTRTGKDVPDDEGYIVYHDYPEPQKTMRRLNEEWRKENQPRPATGHCPFPWDEAPWEKDVQEAGLVTGKMAEMIERIGPDESGLSWDRRQGICWKLWEQAYPPEWAEKHPKEYEEQCSKLEEVLWYNADMPELWIGTGPHDAEEWRKWEGWGLGGTQSLYVAYDRHGHKKHFKTTKRRDVWMKQNPGSHT